MAPVARLAFVEVCTTDRNSFRAAGLVTDRHGGPLEFRVTDLVRPTRMQKVLWGGRLSAHLLVHVLAKPVFDAFDPAPGLVVVRQAYLLGLRPLVGVPVVQLTADPGEPGSLLLTDRPAGAGGDPVYVRPAAEFPGDAGAAVAALGPLAAALPPGEPFARILQAVALVQQEEAPVQAV